MTQNSGKQNKKTGQGSPLRLSYFLCLAAIIGIFILAGGLRDKFIKPFLMIGTMEFSAFKLFSEVVNQGDLLVFLVRHFSFQLLVGYVVSSLFILISVFLLFYILRDIPGLEARLGRFAMFQWKPGSEKQDMESEELSKQADDNISHKENENHSSPAPGQIKILLVFTAIIIIASMVFVSMNYLAGTPVSTDEFSYFFQANIMKDFRLFAPAPAEPEFFETENVVIKDGKWYSKYTVGFPLFLALGLLLRFPLIINPVFSIIAAYFLYLLTLRLFGKQAACIAVVLAFLSPFFFLNGSAGFQPHITLAAALLGAGYFYFLAIDEKKWQNPLFMAVCFTFAALIRPIDAALWGLAFILLSLCLMIIRKDRLALLLRFVAALAAASAGMFLILSVNKIQTGEFLKFAFHQYQQKEVWGFESYGHNIYKGLWNVFHYQARLISWSVIFMLEGALISLLGKERRKALFLWFLYFAFVFFFFGWYAIGHYEYGPRYLFTGFVYLLPASAYGLTLIFSRIREKSGKWRTALFSYLLILFFFTITMIAPSFVPIFKSNITDRISWLKLGKQAKAIHHQTGKKTAIFIANAEGHKVNNGTRNIYPVNQQIAAYFLLLEPEKDMEFLRKYFPEFEPYVAFYDPASNNFSLEKFPDPAIMSAEQKSLYFMFTGLIYRFTLDKYDRAQESWEESYRLNGNNLAPLINLANLLMDKGKDNEAKRNWEEILRKNPDVTAAYQALGRICENKGENEEAGKYYMEYLKRSPDSQEAMKIKERLLYFRNYGKFPE